MRWRIWHHLIVLLAMLTIVGPGDALTAQGPGPLRQGFTNPASAGSPKGPQLVESKTHWKTGFIIGTALMTAVILPFAAWGGDSITLLDVVKVVSGASLVGGVPGALFGGLFPKRE